MSGYAVYVGSSRLNVGNVTTYTMTTAVPGQQYCFAVSAYNATGEGPKSGQVCGYSNKPPTLTSPGNQSSRVGQAVSLQLAGSDPDGLPVSYTATGLPPGLFIGSATGFISGTLTTAGTYSVTARVFDGVLQSTPLTFTWSVTSGSTSDPTAPSISIATPTTGTAFTSTTTNVSVGGSASDNVGVTSVSWSNSRGGSGSASGTTTWSVPAIGLQTGTNLITVTARDGAGNTGIDMLTVTYSATTEDTTAPTISIVGPTSASAYSTGTGVITLGGTASDNRGVTAVTWSNNRGGSGFSSGTTSWSVPSVPLQGGTNIITVTAQDAEGNRGTDVLTVTYSTTALLTGQLLRTASGLRASLQWSGVQATAVDLYRNGLRVVRTANDGTHVDAPSGSSPYAYKICYPETTNCSNTITLAN